MIDWLNLAWNALWILGLSVALAVTGYAYWQSSNQHAKLSERLKRPAQQIGLNLAGTSFCLGLAGSAVKTWEIVLWVLLAGGFIGQGIMAIRQLKQAGRPGGTGRPGITGRAKSP